MLPFAAKHYSYQYSSEFWVGAAARREWLQDVLIRSQDN